MPSPSVIIWTCITIVLAILKPTGNLGSLSWLPVLFPMALGLSFALFRMQMRWLNRQIDKLINWLRRGK